ncbi:DUF551 domain-containing protein [Enterobacter hormaechei]
MSNIDKHAVQAVADLKAGYTLGHADVAILNELARIALASLEAEAVSFDDLRDAVAEVSGGPAMEWSEIYKGHQAVPFINFNSLARIVDKFRAAPPAPVSMPDESAIFDAAIDICRKSDAIDEHAWNHGVLAVMSAFSDCRAAMIKHSEPFIVTSDHRMMEMPQVEAINAVTAMLQGAEPVSNHDELPDGWVACSERMPETAGNYWGWWSESKRQGPVWFIKSELQAQFQSSEITHWMPLPAAPQQEVK